MIRLKIDFLSENISDNLDSELLCKGKKLKIISQYAVGYNNVDFHCADGKLGWRKEAPYDRVLVSAARERMPEILIDQLAPKGYMVIPVCSLNDQLIHIITKDENENIHIKKSTPVRFVTLV